MNAIIASLGISLIVGAAGCASTTESTSTNHAQQAPTSTTTTNSAPRKETAMKLGNFSVSLTVKDIAASRAFYEKLGFEMVAGDQSKNWIVLQNDNARIGLFQGMFPKNTLTFNPGWDGNKNTLPDFQDVRELQKTFKSRGLTPNPAADETTTGPGYLMLMDPDGNPILIDQHVASPARK